MPDNYIIPITRWAVKDGERRPITEHYQSPRLPHIEDLLTKISRENGLSYNPGRADELAGFALNTLLAFEERQDWKPFRSLDGRESDTRQPGFNFIGPAQVISRALIDRQRILTNSFFPNSERRFEIY